MSTIEHRIDALLTVDVAGHLAAGVNAIESRLDQGDEDSASRQLETWESALGPGLGSLAVRLEQLRPPRSHDSVIAFRSREGFRARSFSHLTRAASEGSVREIGKWRWAARGHARAIGCLADDLESQRAFRAARRSLAAADVRGSALPQLKAALAHRRGEALRPDSPWARRWENLARFEELRGLSKEIRAKEDELVRRVQDLRQRARAALGTRRTNELLAACAGEPQRLHRLEGVLAMVARQEEAKEADEVLKRLHLGLVSAYAGTAPDGLGECLRGVLLDRP
jgi:hypothetical protein